MPYRLGDIVDDYCSRCRMISNNSVQAMVGEEIVKVCCRTCNSSHDYKHGKLPEKAKPRKTSTKAAFDAVLASVMAGKNLEAEASGTSAALQKTSRSRRPIAHHGLRTLSAAKKKKPSEH
jgi:hypothetical protein